MTVTSCPEGWPASPGEILETFGPLVVGLPLLRKKGDLAAFAVVDADDFEFAGRFRWFLRPNGYVARNASMKGGGQKIVLLHRQVTGLQVGERLFVDHVNHNPLDNRSANLRICSHAENHQNRAAYGNRGSTSQYRGVSYNRFHKSKPWRAYGTLDQKRHGLGNYATEEEAAAVSAAWRREHMPFAID